jgi:hypothetical protein
MTKNRRSRRPSFPSTGTASNGRGLTYRERWEQLRAWLDDPLNWDFGSRIHVFGAKRGICDQMDRLNETRLVRARRKGPGPMGRTGRRFHGGDRITRRRCDDCGKLCYTSQADARRSQLHAGYRMKIYRCGAAWHVTNLEKR